MEKELKLTEKERELIEAIRNLRKMKHNYSVQFEEYARRLFDEMIDED
jgi:hypothetical protein